MTSYRIRLKLLVLVGQLAAGAIALVPAAAETQAVVRFGRGSATLELPVHLTVPVRLTVDAAGAERVVGQTPSFTEVELPIRVAANLAWTLTVALGATSDLGPVLVRTVAGDWVALSATSPSAAVTGWDATNPIEVKVRLRLPAGMNSTETLRLRLALVPANTAGH